MGTLGTAVMLDLVHKIEFWVAMIVASILKFKASPPMTFLGAALTVAAGLGSAMICTGPIVQYLDVQIEEFEYVVAAMVFLTAEHGSRAILSLDISDLIKIYRGK